MLTVIWRQNILRTITIKEVLILVTNILDQIVLKVWEYSPAEENWQSYLSLIIMFSVYFFCNISSCDILAYITKNYITLIYYAKIANSLSIFQYFDYRFCLSEEQNAQIFKSVQLYIKQTKRFTPLWSHFIYWI
jgi:hypothetical protein